MKTKIYKLEKNTLFRMGILNKLAFWKKHDDLNFDDLAAKELGTTPQNDLGLQENPATLGLNEKSPFQEQAAETQPLPTHLQESPFPQKQPVQGSRDMELISSKLDTIKAILQSMEQRIAKIEQAAGIEQQKQRLW